MKLILRVFVLTFILIGITGCSRKDHRWYGPAVPVPSDTTCTHHHHGHGH